jgi:hypothetical protein
MNTLDEAIYCMIGVIFPAAELGIILVRNESRSDLEFT